MTTRDRRKTRAQATGAQATDAPAADPERLPELDIQARDLAKLHAWYVANARDLPWRHTRDPYAIWLSEVMLQQTQVATVIPYYERWLARFPDLETLAAADEGDILLHWEGLGYYRRARNFHRAVRQVVAEYGGEVPTDVEAFRALPGVGDYTAAAVFSIAFGAKLAVVDGNVKRVLARLSALSEAPTTSRITKHLQAQAQALLLRREVDPSIHNQAMMELGARICTPRAPLCTDCPLAGVCVARELGTPEDYPRKGPRKVVPQEHLAVAIVHDDRGRILLYQRPYGGLLAGLWDLPSVALRDDKGERLSGASVTESATMSALEGYLREAWGLVARVEGDALSLVTHAYTHLRVTLHPYRCVVRSGRRSRQGSRAAEATPSRWVAPEEFGAQAMPRASHKVLALLREA
ncbi:MAG: A/G-specific adenine glycosylase [Deltaproteobacteria bacterium]|nr:A/G-specific adenine glycosylase [Deltaproteobacteria bacterium]